MTRKESLVFLTKIQRRGSERNGFTRDKLDFQREIKGGDWIGVQWKGKERFYSGFNFLSGYDGK